MIRASKKLLLCTILLTPHIPTFASLTSMQHWNPSPIFNALNSNMPPDSYFSHIINARLKGEAIKERRFGFTLSPFIQRAVRASDRNGNDYGDYNYTEANKPLAREMSDYQGTPYLMGLFLGADADGNSIWDNNDDTGVATNIGNIANTSLPKNLKDAATNISGILYNSVAGNKPSILSQSVLEQDRTYFGAISIPLTYEKIGLRWEANFDVNQHIGLVLRGGVCQIKQSASNYISLTNATKANSGDADTDTIYKSLNVQGGATAPPAADTTQQVLFDTNITNNVAEILDPINGANYNISSFSDFGFEDIEAGFFLRKAVQMHPPQESSDRYDSVIMTPYVYVGGAFPISKQRDYNKLFSLPTGNSGHASVGGSAGFTFDFAHSVEIGVEGGITHFFQKDIVDMPVPNHRLQRVLYPYRRDVNVDPGRNWHFKGLFSAYEFMPGASFFLTYQYTQHTKDTIKLKKANANFLPEKLEDLSPWTVQQLTASISFAIQPNIHASLAWQGALKQENAYASHTILGSINFLF